MRFAPSLPACLALGAGVATVFGFAPFAAPLIPLVTLALLFLLWQDAPPRGAARTGFAFGVGLFGAGVSWVYIAIHTFGGMPAVLAAIGTAGFVAYLALFPAAAGWLATRWTPARSWQRALACAGAWTALEWLRSWLLSGFGWLSLGYSQAPGTPFAGYAPLGGVFAVTLVLAVAAALLAVTIDVVTTAAVRRIVAAAGGIVALGAGGAVLGTLAWTTPVGAPLAVSLVQGNVLQDVKFDPDFTVRTYDLYTELAAASRGRLIVLPESAFPVFADEVPEAVLHALLGTAADRNGDLLLGLFTVEPALAGSDQPRYYNSVVTLGTAPTQLYRKRHLVPFGETIPLEGVLGPAIRTMLAIPIASQSAGDAGQPPLDVAGQKVAVDICYEDAFGADIRPQAAQATILVNVTNDAWYGRSIAAEQHAQIAQMRALETGRPMLRATNTGITSAITADGREVARLPWFTRGILEVDVVGRTGVTPFVRWGDLPAAGVAMALVVAASLLARRGFAGRAHERLGPDIGAPFETP